MDNDTLQTILMKHKKYLNNEVGGERANLQGADLQYANLQGANLQGADLRYADLQYANLQGANLQGANLQYADLQGADLRYADLQGANLQSAYLRYADLQGADLQGAYLQCANLQGAYLQCADLQYANLQSAKNIPEYVEKQFNTLPKNKKLTGYKKCKNDVIVTLEIPAKAKRSKATSNKCRAEYAKVIALSDGATSAISSYNSKFEYVVGKMVKPDSWDNNWNNECSNGIHFFLSMDEAKRY